MSNANNKTFLRRYPLDETIWTPHQGSELLGLIELIKRIQTYWDTATNSPFISVVPNDDQGLYDTFLLDLDFLLEHSSLDGTFRNYIRDSIPPSFMDSDLALAMDEDILGGMKDEFRRAISALRQEALKRGIKIYEGDTTGLFSLFDEELSEIHEQNRLAIEEREVQLGLRKSRSSTELLKDRVEKLEIRLRSLIGTSLPNGWTDVPNKVQRDAMRRMKNNQANTPNGQNQESSSLFERLAYCDLADLETILLSIPCWTSLEKCFNDKSQVTLRFSLLKPFRNDLAHHRTSNKVVLADANSSLTWFEHAIEGFTQHSEEESEIPF